MSTHPFVPPAVPRRPNLTLDTLPAYLDWCLDNASSFRNGDFERYIAAAELLVRHGGNLAQGKATQHTLVEDGVIAPPPHAS